MSASPNIVYVNHNDEVIGTAPIGEVYDNFRIARVATIFVFNPAGELYIQKRGDHLYTYPGYFAASVAGHVDEGEDYLDTARREAEEEIGLTDLKLTKVAYYLENSHNALLDREERRFNTLFETHLSDTQAAAITPDGDEVAGGHWARPEAVAAVMDDEPNRYAPALIWAIRTYLEAKGIPLPTPE